MLADGEPITVLLPSSNSSLAAHGWARKNKLGWWWMREEGVLPHPIALFAEGTDWERGWTDGRALRAARLLLVTA